MNAIFAVPDWLFLCVSAPFIGSFLGVVAIRLPRGEHFIKGRSACRACDHVLGPLDLVPIASWLAARARCRHCGAPVSVFYPLMEVGAFLVAISAALVSSGPALWIGCAFGFVLLTLAATDGLYFLLPDSLTLPLIAAGLGASYLLDQRALGWHIAGACAGFLGFRLLNFIYRAIRGRDGLGGGDAKLLAASGAWVALSGLPSVLLLGACAGLCAVLAATVLGRPMTATERIPLGSFLCLGTWIVWLLGPIGFAPDRLLPF